MIRSVLRLQRRCPYGRAQNPVDAHEILNQILLAILRHARRANDYDPPALHGQQLLKVVEAEAGQPILVLNHDETDGRIGDQLESFRRVSLTPEPISFTTAATW